MFLVYLDCEYGGDVDGGICGGADDDFAGGGKCCQRCSVIMFHAIDDDFFPGFGDWLLEVESYEFFLFFAEHVVQNFVGFFDSECSCDDAGEAVQDVENCVGAERLEAAVVCGLNAFRDDIGFAAFFAE